MADGMGIIVLEDRFKKKSTMKFWMVGGSLTKVQDFADWLKGHCDARIKHVAFSEQSPYADTATSGAYDDVEQKLVVNFEDLVEVNPMRRNVTLSIAAPAENCFEDSDLGGQRIESDLAEDIKDEFSTVTGRTLSFKGAYLESKHRKHERTFVQPTGV